MDGVRCVKMESLVIRSVIDEGRESMDRRRREEEEKKGISRMDRRRREERSKQNGRKRERGSPGVAYQDSLLCKEESESLTPRSTLISLKA